MKHPLNFVPLRQWNPGSIDELIEISNKHLSYQEQVSDMSNFQITPQGTLQGDNLEMRFSEKGFLQLCRFLKIPNPFANFITWELLQDNINRIARGIIEKEAALYFYENDKGENICVNVTSTRYQTIPHEVLLAPLSGLDFDIDRMTVEDNFMDIYVSNPLDSHVKPLEVKKGDTIKSGIRLRNSTSNYGYPEARNMYWRLVCSNGMIMPISEGQLRIKLKRGQESLPKIESFMVELNAMISELTNYPDFEGLLDSPLDSVQFARWWKSIKRITGDSEYTDDFIFQVDEESRKHWISQSRMVAKEDAEPEITTINSWDLLNRLTDKAKSFDPETTSKLEEVAGKFLTKV